MNEDIAKQLKTRLERWETLTEKKLMLESAMEDCEKIEREPVNVIKAIRLEYKNDKQASIFNPQMNIVTFARYFCDHLKRMHTKVLEDIKKL